MSVCWKWKFIKTLTGGGAGAVADSQTQRGSLNLANTHIAPLKHAGFWGTIGESRGKSG